MTRFALLKRLATVPFKSTTVTRMWVGFYKLKQSKLFSHRSCKQSLPCREAPRRDHQASWAHRHTLAAHCEDGQASREPGLRDHAKEWLAVWEVCLLRHLRHGKIIQTSKRPSSKLSTSAHMCRLLRRRPSKPWARRQVHGLRDHGCRTRFEELFFYIVITMVWALLIPSLIIFGPSFYQLYGAGWYFSLTFHTKPFSQRI